MRHGLVSIVGGLLLASTAHAQDTDAARTQHAQWQLDNETWASEYKLWQADHKKADELIKKLQARMKEHAAAMAREEAMLREQEKRIHDHEVVLAKGGYRSDAKLEEAHRKTVDDHAKLRQMHEVGRRMHTELGKLLKMLEELDAG